MHTKFFSWLSLLVVLASFLAPEAAAQGSVIDAPKAVLSAGRSGKIIAKNVVGTVTYNSNVAGATAAPVPLGENQEIGEGNIVHTGVGSSVVLLFENGASLKLGDTTDLNISEFKLDPVPPAYNRTAATEEPSLSNTDITLTRGELIGNVKTLKKTPGNNSKFKVSTPVGAAGIRGTVFKIVYRPVGDGRTGVYNFVMTTVEGNVEVVVGTGTVTTPPVQVTDNKEVVLNNVEVNVTTNQVTATTSTGVTAAVTVTPPPADAPITTVQQVTVVAQQLAQQIATAVFTPAPTTTTTNPTEKPKEEKKEPASSGPTSKPDSITPGT
ncbi:MAG: FecR domain-containing protein [Verrucomicrobia bacterium]|nr:FecR domain-containing protein [Verrucomicrobiota bacterium]